MAVASAIGTIVPAGIAVYCSVTGYAADRIVPLFIETPYVFARLLFFVVRPGIVS
ncbi:hypothetical protein [Natrinema soli]|uniref:TRAP C4-dicarboxylate transport system permease DctM subunit domain-containing protein n=1 Tax=Natrinema soli TaxID=1930624 RepID=A0ABD5SXK2_9EURY|nr:hypothetical protein [Natrinema soli]